MLAKQLVAYHVCYGKILFHDKNENIRMFIAGDQEGLTDVKILRLSGQFTKQQDLRDVAIKGLNISSKTVETHINSNQSRMNDAAYSLFQEWRDTQSSPKTAYTRMREALERVNKPLFKLAL